uniref:uncharacterized protein LOC122582464 n=1 Tax=Erigeron canadensis TaxID=72917 RepID=UPI001CB9B4F2|nr:uncharacterized protein LOC122582464 [Erigeron canadensis]
MAAISLFPIGCKVEVSSDEEGFDGSWYVATVINIIKKKKSKKTMYEVNYDTLNKEVDTNEPLTEVVDPSFVRPVPPVGNYRDFEVNDVVDVYLRDGWWIGVVKKVIIIDNGDQKSRKYVVASFQDEVESEKSGLRFHREWVDSCWRLGLPPNKKNNEDTCVAKNKRKNVYQRENKENVHKKKEPSLNENIYELASILKSLTTRQQAHLHEIGFGCLIGFYIEHLPRKLQSLAVDRLDAVNCEMMVHGTLMKITKQDVHDILGFPMGIIQVKAVKKAGLGDTILVSMWKTRYPRFRNGVQRIHLSDVMQMITSQPEGGSNFKIDILVAIMTIMGEGKSNGVINQWFLGSVNNENDIKNMDWCGYVIECLRRSKENGSWNAGLLAFLVVWYAQKISKQQKETPAILHWTFEELKAIEQMECSEVNFVSNQERKDGEETHELIPLSVDQSDHVGFPGSSCFRPPDQHDEASGALNNDIMNQYQQVWPFVKQSAFWATIESLEFFRQPSQKPHFSPLKKVKVDHREGLAISCVVTFKNLVDKISKIQLTDPVDIINDSLETLVDLETHGFDVGAVRACLNEMLSLKDKVGQLRDLERKVEESKKCEQVEMNHLEVSVKKLQKEMEMKNEEVKKLQKEKVMKNEKVMKLQSNSHLLSKQILDCEHSFKKLTATSL